MIVLVISEMTRVHTSMNDRMCARMYVNVYACLNIANIVICTRPSSVQHASL